MRKKLGVKGLYHDSVKVAKLETIMLYILKREVFFVCSHVTSHNQGPFSRKEEIGPWEVDRFVSISSHL